jgi:ABC-type polysaccharide/polyol phosphate transport system ATPase subunit
MASSSLHLLRKILLLILLIIIMDQSSPIVEDDFKEVSPANTVNINVGVLGHIDSGKTSLCRVLSKVHRNQQSDLFYCQPR